MKRVARFFRVFFLYRFKRRQPDYYNNRIDSTRAINIPANECGAHQEDGIKYRIPYDPEHDEAIDNLKASDWNVRLEADADGQLFYVVQSINSATTPRV